MASYDLGSAEIRRGNAAGAESAFSTYLNQNPDDTAVYFSIAAEFEKQKNWTKIVEYYDKIYAVNAGMVTDWQMMSVYKKACKKSGLQRRYLG